MLGKGLKALGVPRSEYIVSTKCGRYGEGFDFSAERVTRSIDESLARLQLDYVDILHCHDIEFGSLDQVCKCVFQELTGPFGGRVELWRVNVMIKLVL